MTSLLAWVGVDNRAPASVYLASDSRISWGGDQRVWDYGRKLFASTKYPEVVGYCGDVLFPSLVLGQVVDLIDSDALFTPNDTPDNRWKIVSTIVKRSFAGYPADPKLTFTIAYCTRQGSEMQSSFHMYKLTRSPNSIWVQSDDVVLPTQSGVIDMFGSGKSTIEKWNQYWQNTRESRTSRSMFGAFCDALYSGEDRNSGGSPQLVGIYRQGPAQSFGIIYGGHRYLLGLPVDEAQSLSAIEWRNSVFERCDFRTMKPLESAQHHSRPKGLARSER